MPRSNDDERPDPDVLLKAVSEQEVQKLKGHLRIFLGMSAGVGKTFAMLRAARQKQVEGCDIVVGVVETHGRRETAALLDGLTIIPRKKVEYKGTLLEEMDIDAILARAPALVLVDELAHSNIPGSRHYKRYQDVLELLDAGIDVYTTINVQHFESRKESVEQITGIPIRETVPDSILERASLVEVVDIAPSELLKRLGEGKVYLGDRAAAAAQNFFKEDKLTALREIVLRLTAEKVDQDLQKFAEIRQTSSSPWQANERLMVAVSHSPYSERLIRATRRLAYNLEAPWIAVHIDTGVLLNNEDQAQLIKNLNLARELMAEVITTTEVDVTAALKRIARQKNVTQIIVGRPTRRWIKDMLRGGTSLDRLVWESVEVDVHVIRQDGIPTYRTPILQELKLQSGPVKYWNTFLWLLLVTLLSHILNPLIGYKSIGFIYLLGVLIVGLVSYIGPVIFGAAISAIVWNFFFIPPRFTFAIGASEDIIMCVSFFVVALIIGFLTSRVRFHEAILREREERQTVLFEVLRDIANSPEKSEFLFKTAQRVGKLLNAQCGIMLKDQSGKLLNRSDTNYSIVLDEKELAVASWAFEKQKTAGWSTDTLSEAKALYIPLHGTTEKVGVFVFKPLEGRKLSIEQANLLFSITRQLAVSLERHFFEKRFRESERLQDSEKLHQTLLNSISHEMRTPLTTIMGSATALADENMLRDPAYVREIARQLLEASDRLNRVIENLLDMSRLNSGVLALKLEWHDVSDLIGVTINKLGKNLSHHKIKVQVPQNLVMLNVDGRFMEHALSNLLLNAATYSPQGSEILLSVRQDGKIVRISVEDQGPGIPEDSQSKVFEKFYRVPGTPTGGTGLGLSIVKSIVEAHKGHVFVENREHGSSELSGARFVIELPFQEAPSVPQEVS